MDWYLHFKTIDAFGTSLMVATIPYFSRKIGASFAFQGFMGSAYGILQLVGSPISMFY